jgi:hypothetical protein
VTSVIMAVVKAVHGRVGEVTGVVQPTQSQELQFISEDGTKLLGLEGLALVGVELEQDGARVVHVITEDEGAAAYRRVPTTLAGSTLKNRRTV